MFQPIALHEGNDWIIVRDTTNGWFTERAAPFLHGHEDGALFPVVAGGSRWVCVACRVGVPSVLWRGWFDEHSADQMAAAATRDDRETRR